MVIIVDGMIGSHSDGLTYPQAHAQLFNNVGGWVMVGTRLCSVLQCILCLLLSDHDSLQEMLYKLFHTLLMYSLQEEQDGWNIWVETTAAMHVFVSEAVPTY